MLCLPTSTERCLLPRGLLHSRGLSLLFIYTYSRQQSRQAIYNHCTCRFYIIIIKLRGLQNPEIQCRIHNGSPIIPILSRFNVIPRSDNYFFKILSNLSSHLRVGLPKGLFPVGVPVNILKAVLPFFHSGYMPCPSQFSRINHSDYIRSTVQTMKFLIVNLLHSPFSSLLDPNIRLRILFSNTLSLDSSLNVRDHVSQPYSTTGNIIVLHILIFREVKSVWTE